MRRRRIVNTRLAVLVLLLLRVSPALAQSAIAGVVKDTSGAVIPGVTVVASSPALISPREPSVRRLTEAPAGERRYFQRAQRQRPDHESQSVSR